MPTTPALNAWPLPADPICEWCEEPDPTATLRSIARNRAAVLCERCGGTPQILSALLEDS